jgi:hypothetical protein
VKTREEQILEAKALARKRIEFMVKFLPPLNDAQRELLVYFATEMYFQGRVDAAIEFTCAA